MAKVYFKEIHIFGLENVPRDKPVIISCNHNSQFVDALLLIISIPRPINFIIAASSTTHPFLRYFLKMVYVIPTVRPMDVRKKGKGEIQSLKNGVITGSGTLFTAEFKPGDSIRLSMSHTEMLITEIISDSQLKISGEASKSSSSNKKDKKNDEKPENEAQSYQNQVQEARRLTLEPSPTEKFDPASADEQLSAPCEYDIYPKLNQEQVYSKAIDVLGNRHVLGIFPEGGSHDKTELLPLKAGACIFIWAVKEKKDVDAHLQCIGINYYGAHKFRSKVVINIGKLQSFDIDKSKITDREYKRQFISSALEELTAGMEDVKISAPTLCEMLNLYTAKEILLTEDSQLDAKKDFELFKKFCTAYKKIKDLPEIQKLNQNIYAFRRTLKAYGLKVSDLRNYKKTFGEDLKMLSGKVLLLTLLVNLLDFALLALFLAPSAYHSENR